MQIYYIGQADENDRTVSSFCQSCGCELVYSGYIDSPNSFVDAMNESFDYDIVIIDALNIQGVSDADLKNLLEQYKAATEQQQVVICYAPRGESNSIVSIFRETGFEYVITDVLGMQIKRKLKDIFAVFGIVPQKQTVSFSAQQSTQAVQQPYEQSQQFMPPVQNPIQQPEQPIYEPPKPVQMQQQSYEQPQAAYEQPREQPNPQPQNVIDKANNNVAHKAKQNKPQPLKTTNNILPGMKPKEVQKQPQKKARQAQTAQPQKVQQSTVQQPQKIQRITSAQTAVQFPQQEETPVIPQVQIDDVRIEDVKFDDVPTASQQVTRITPTEEKPQVAQVQRTQSKVVQINNPYTAQQPVQEANSYVQQQPEQPKIQRPQVQQPQPVQPQAVRRVGITEDNPSGSSGSLYDYVHSEEYQVNQSEQNAQGYAQIPQKKKFERPTQRSREQPQEQGSWEQSIRRQASNGENTRSNKRTSIAVIGIMNRIGTTTQALQIVRFLQQTDRHACYVQAGKSNKFLEGIKDYFTGVDVDRNSDAVLFDDLYMVEKRNLMFGERFDYEVFDYGYYEEIPADFFEKDMRIVVCGGMPTEIEAFNHLVSQMYGDRDILYIFSFISDSDQGNVLDMMADKRDHCFFAPYAPDCFTLNEENADFYYDLFGMEKPVQKKKSLFGRRKR